MPKFGDLTEVIMLAQQLNKNNNPSKLNLTYTDVCNIDVIEVNIVPEKKGVFLKHTEYQVSSKVKNLFNFKLNSKRIQQIFNC